MAEARIKKKQYAMITAVFLMTTMTMVSQCQWLTSLELNTIDLRTRWMRKDLPAPANIQLILIDEASLAAMQSLYGRWPWPRKVFAELIDYLSDCGAAAVLVDVLFTERQVASGPRTRLSPDDAALVSATHAAGNVFHSAQFNQDPEDDYNQSVLNRPLPSVFTERFAYGKTADATFNTANTYYLPFQALYLAAKGVGAVSITPDSDGVYRRVAPLVRYGDHLYAALAMAPLFMDSRLKPAGSGDIILNLSNKKYPQRLHLDADNQYFINMYGKFDTYSFGGVYLSLLKIRKGILTDLPVAPEVFAGKTIFIGASAAGVEDLKHSALGPRTPGVFLHAAAYGNIVQNDMLTFAPGYVQLAVTAGIILLSIITLFFFERLRLKITGPLVLLLGWNAVCLIFFSRNLVLPMAAPAVATLYAYLVSLSLLNFTEGRERRKIKNVLGQYVSPTVLATVLEHSTEEFMRAEIGSKEELTVFFSDIRGFTSLTERYPVEKVVEILNNYLSAMTDIIFENQGTLDKFVGDAVIAFWGAPIRDDTHPIKAVRSALKMQHALKRLNMQNQNRHLPQLNMGIGMHTDHVILGNIGCHRKLDYTIIGDGVNLASRLEGLTKMYNIPILISQTTYERVQGDICCRIVDYVKVKGKQKPIRIYAVLGLLESMTTAENGIIRLAEKAFGQYTCRDFIGAQKSLTQLLQTAPNDYLAKVLLYRCRQYQHHPPPEDWDGYYEYHTK